MRPMWARLLVLAAVLGTVVTLACRSPVVVEITWGASGDQHPPGALASPTPGRVAQPPTPNPAAQQRGVEASAVASPLFFHLRTPPPVELEIPKIGLIVPVVPVPSVAEGDQWYWPVPEDAAGHLLGSANPGEPGNIAVSGHVDTRRGPGIFAQLDQLRGGDIVVLRSADGEFLYQVTEVLLVPEDDRSVLRQTATEVLTLITCVPVGDYSQRLVVRAQRVSAS